MLFRTFFWISNLCFLLIAYVGILPYLGRSFFPDLIAGDLPFDIFLPFLGLIGTPTVSTVSRGISKLTQKKVEVNELKSLPEHEIRVWF